MRIFVMGISIIAFAAAPCAWDADPGEPSAIAALFAWPALATDASAVPAAPEAAIPAALNGLPKR